MSRRAKWPYTERSRDGWRASVLSGGRRVKGKVFPTQQQAHSDALQMMEQRDAGSDPANPMTLGQALAAIEKDCERRERRDATFEFYKSHLGALIKHFGEDQVVARISMDHLQDFIDKRRAAKMTGLTIKHDLQALTRAVRIAGVAPNPVQSIKLVRPRVLRRDPGLNMSWVEVIAVLIKLGDLGALEELGVLAFVAGCGVRRTEFCRMRRSDIDMAGERIIIPIGKTHPRELPLPNVQAASDACEVLLSLNPGGQFLLPGATERKRIEWLRQVVVRARAQTGQPRLQLHELRRCFASRVAERFPMPVVAALLGHALPGTTGLYVHADKATLRRAMEDLWRDVEAT